MSVNKILREFHRLDLQAGDWRLPEGYDEGALAAERVLSGALDVGAKRGSRTRLLRFDPGFFTTQPFVHTYWEEVFLLAGEMNVGSDENGEGGEAFAGYTYAVRPPGAPHGPFSSKTGALLLEIHYFDPA